MIERFLEIIRSILRGTWKIQGILLHGNYGNRQVRRKRKSYKACEKTCLVCDTSLFLMIIGNFNEFLTLLSLINFLERIEAGHKAYQRENAKKVDFCLHLKHAGRSWHRLWRLKGPRGDLARSQASYTRWKAPQALFPKYFLQSGLCT